MEMFDIKIEMPFDLEIQSHLMSYLTDNGQKIMCKKGLGILLSLKPPIQ